MVVRHARTNPPRPGNPWSFLRSPAAGSVPHIYTKGATAYYSRAGWPVCGGGVGQAGGCAARRQGMGEKGSAPAGALGERRWGAFSESAKDGADREDLFPAGRWVAGSENQPYVGDAGLGPTA